MYDIIYQAVELAIAFAIIALIIKSIELLEKHYGKYIKQFWKIFIEW